MTPIGSTTALILPEKTIITITAMITGVTITQICRAMPTAVMTESSEKKDVNKRDLNQNAGKAWCLADIVLLFDTLDLDVDFMGALGNQE
jgi:hypothetical protein